MLRGSRESIDGLRRPKPPAIPAARRRFLWAALGLLLPIQAFWLGCSSFGEDSLGDRVEDAAAHAVDVDVARPVGRAFLYPGTLIAGAISPRAGANDAFEPERASMATEDYLLPADNPWVQRARIRGIQWPMVANQGAYRAYEPQVGLASYYHEPQRLATGERYRPADFSAAHKTLPFGTIVRCTRTDTNESVIVIINDRGPFKAERIIDLSTRAASVIHQIGEGIVPCRLEVLAYPLIDAMGPKGNG
jgi:rare lipoprotein A